MQSLAAAMPFRRLYSTRRVRMPKEALIARTASTPLAVRLRRSKKFGPIAPGETDATPEGLTPTENARFLRLRAKGEISRDTDPAKFASAVNTRRSRIRGFKRVKQSNGETLTHVVGRRVYLPNLVFRLVRNHTPPGEPYNPYEATFRVPNSVTKTDVRSYLWAVYGVRTTYIRTDNYFAPVPTRGRTVKTHKTYKRAVVGLRDPFYYPLRLEDMQSEQRAEREKWLEQNFAIEATRQANKQELVRLTKGAGIPGWKFKDSNLTKRSHILQMVAERRASREKLIVGYASEFKDMREKGDRITRSSIKRPDAPHEERSSVPAVL